MRNSLIFILLFIFHFSVAQQNEEFQSVKKYFDYQRFMLNDQFKKRFDEEDAIETKISIKKDFSEFMQKMDSIQNTALIGALIKVKNREDLQRFDSTKKGLSTQNSPEKSELSSEAKYPGGFNNLRQQVAGLFYSGAVLADQKTLKAVVAFVVERDGSITSVHAEGNNTSFNRQAEIAMYLLPDKFDPAYVDGTPVRYRFRLPLAMNFE